MKLIYLMLLLLVVVIISKCRCRVVEGMRKTMESQEIASPDNDSIKYAQNQLITGPDSWWTLSSEFNELPVTVEGQNPTPRQNPLFYVCGNASGLKNNTGVDSFVWHSNTCENNDCTLERCVDGDNDCITTRNNASVRIGTYCDKYAESGGSHELTADFESYVRQFISCPNEGDEIYGLHKLEDSSSNVVYEFLHKNGAKYGVCPGAFNIYDGPFPQGVYASGNRYTGSHGSGTAFTCEQDNSEKTSCNHETDKLWQILT